MSDILVYALVGCETTGETRRALNARPMVRAYSCDLLPADDGETKLHIVGDVLEVIRSRKWDLGILHPPCTYISNSGVHHLYNEDNTYNWDRYTDLQKGVTLFNACVNAPIFHLAVENPIPHKWAKQLMDRPDYDQLIQPWKFGHAESKATCFWLKNLPQLNETKIMKDIEQSCWKMPPGDKRGRERSKTFPGIAKAMAEQWSDYVIGKKLGTL